MLDSFTCNRSWEVPMITSVLMGLRRYWRLLVPLVAVLVVGGAVAGTSLATSSTSSSKTTSSAVGAIATQGAVVRVVQAVSPSVVQIQDQIGLGSGIVFDNAGHIVTNNHVVTGATSLTVTTSSGKQYPAKVVGSFPPDDLAVIEVTGAHLKPATFGNSSRLTAGDTAIAIGNPLGLRSSVTDGIVSGFRQAVAESASITLPSVIQTSAAINPGNSGGALVDIQGRVIGIPTLTATNPEIGGSAPGIGFAIPSDTVKDVASQIVKYGRVVNSHRAYFGISVSESSGSGVYVSAVTAGGPAAKAGIRVGDVLVSVNGKQIETTGEFSTVLTGLTPGRRVPVVVKLQNGTQSMQVTVGTYP
jgi:S1-C subfamily serine protease